MTIVSSKCSFQLRCSYPLNSYESTSTDTLPTFTTFLWQELLSPLSLAAIMIHEEVKKIRN
jgi:hypothetical protein